MAKLRAALQAKSDELSEALAGDPKSIQSTVHDTAPRAHLRGLGASDVECQALQLQACESERERVVQSDEASDVNARARGFLESIRNAVASEQNI